MRFTLPNKGQQDRHFDNITEMVVYIQNNKERLTMPVTVYCDDKKITIPQGLIELPEDKLIIYMNYFMEKKVPK